MRRLATPIVAACLAAASFANAQTSATGTASRAPALTGAEQINLQQGAQGGGAPSRVATISDLGAVLLGASGTNLSGSACTGGDDTDEINAALAKGGLVALPGRTCIISGTLNVTQSSTHLVGKGVGGTFIRCVGSSGADCIRIGGQSKQVYNTTIEGVYVVAPSRVGGACIDIDGAANLLISRFALGPCFNSVSDTWSNNVVLEHFVIQGVKGDYGLLWTSPANDTRRSDVLILNDGVINALYSGADGLILDGMVQTLRLNGVSILGARHALWVRNTARSTSHFPAFVFANDLEVDGATLVSVQIDGGAEFHFTNSDLSNTSGSPGQGGADTDCFIVNPDLGASVTRNIFVTGGRVGNCQQRAMNINARDVHITGVNVHSASKEGRSAYPQVELGPNAVDIDVTGGKIAYEFGDPANASYGVVVDPGATNVALTGINFSGNLQGEVLNQTRGSVNITGGIGHDNAPMPIYLGQRNSDPTSPQPGTCYHNTLSSHGRCWTGASWVQIY
ncbi:hypothetical protein [Phenylobacterium montanum]|uniref:Pectate lyase superfamily protein domain-containing protein n=1 Tax=Phenylobacterium montanum TaxID=2823693 RepID=A0A975G0X2_9CAUL|nr:hypothetical protein [Caulobacter sp. S6]QUD89083.1 hypothetical protein KCG34_04130 [Caulobacter sp. S6]